MAAWLRELLVQMRIGAEHASGASEKFFESMPSRTLENALLATFIMLDI